MKLRRYRRAICTASCLLVVLGSHPSAQRADARTSFQDGLNALHLFEYEDANEAFRRARQIDPGFALAYWGEAMTYNQTLWAHEDVRSARQALARLGPTPAARGAKAATPRDKELIAAVESLFGDGDAAIRRQRYADAMGRLHAREPDDPDVASLYALALLGTMSRSLIGYVDTHEGHSLALAGSTVQTQVAAILEGVLRSHPDHTGALHYLLHNDDDPAHASHALGAARTLARVAPASSHALHMPAHIFLQLGLWEDAASSDAAAFKASEAWVSRKGLPAAMRNYHALSWLQYERLQQGRYRDARAAIATLEPVVKATGQLALLSDLSTMRARYVIETASWSLMANESTFGNANELFAIGISAARSGNVSLAERARQGLAERRRDEREGDLRPAIAIMEREVAALIAFASGRRDEALSTLDAAARAELQLPAPLGLPVPIKPAPELLGDLLIEAGRAGEADAFFDAALERNPKRSLALAGRARAAAASGQAARARARYDELLGNFASADDNLPLLQEARRARASLDQTGAAGVELTQPPRPGQPLERRSPVWWLGLFTSPGGLLIVGLAVGAVVVTWLVARQSMRATPARTKKRARDGIKK
jgi:tetratricopeptide (TPR) repeat protein